MNKKNKNVVIIGGGTGLKTLIKSLKLLDSINLDIIVAVSDDGQNSGLLREHFNIPAVGDVRQVISVLADNEELERLINYRFSKDNKILSNYAVGNILLLALLQIHNNNFCEAVNQLKKVLNIKGSLLPVTNENLVLNCMDINNNLIKGESKIEENSCGTLKKVFYDKKVIANPEAVEAIRKADYIVLSIGSLFSSILANLAIEEISQATIENKQACLVYLSNLVQQKYETENMHLLEHIKAIEDHLKNLRKIDFVVYNNKEFVANIWEKYEKLGYKKVLNNVGKKLNKTKIIECDILDTQSQFLRHSETKIFNFFVKFFK